MPSAVEIRPMQVADLPQAAATTAAAFGLDGRDEALARRWEERVAFCLASDPDGAFVAERGRRIIGAAQALRRERLWVLSLLAIEPGRQSAGAGRALLAETLAYGSTTDAGIIVSSDDWRAIRLYRLAGFSVRPTLKAEGVVDRGALPKAHPEVREGGSADLEALAPISRDIRGAPHTAEVEFALGQGARLLRLGDRGFVVLQPGAGVWLLAARDPEAAAAVLWSGLGLVGGVGGPVAHWIMGEQEWAIDVLLQAGLRLTASGALCLRGRPGSLQAFLPSGPFA